MTDGATLVDRHTLIKALSTLADAIEANPPLIVGSDIFVQAALGAHAVGSHISVTAGAGAGSGVGQRISVVAKPGQSVIWQRITVVVGDVPPSAPSPGASSQQEVDNAVAQLRDAARVLASTSASQGWINGVLSTVSKWGAQALSDAISGASNAVMTFYLTDS